MNIIPAIDRFINNRLYHYSLLINGKWGSGKTYFVKETLIPHIEKTNRDVNYLSLYGIKSTDEISQMLCLQAIKNKVPVLESKGGQIVTKVLSSVFKGGMNVIGVGDTGIEGIAEMIPNYDNNVIIFDDLERCGCPINEVLGYINNFVEHSDASVILVANEDEIGKWQLDRNPEMQMLIAMDSRVKVELPSTMDDYIRSYQKQDTPVKKEFTPDEVEYRRKAIFHSNEGYKAIKEKVIGLTINYEPDLNQIFETLIEKNIPNGVLSDRLNDELAWFVSTATKDDHRNLRTFQYFLEKVTLIFETIKNQYPTVHQILLRYTYRSSIRYMKGEKMPEWDGDYGNQIFGKGHIFSLDQEFGFRFIDELIWKNTIEATNVNEVIPRFARIGEKKGQLSTDPYRFISNWWTAEDEEIEEWLTAIEENVKSGKYSTELYTELIRYLAALKVYHIKEDKCESIFQAMQDFIKTADPSELESLDGERFILDSETGKIYRSMRDVLSKLLDEAKRESEKQKYVNAISDPEKWATNLVQASANTGNLIGHSFVYWLEPELILDRINSSDNAELYQFRCALQCVYEAHVYYEHKNDDYDHLKAIHDGVESVNTSGWGEVKKAYQEWIINDTDRYLERIKPEKSDL